MVSWGILLSDLSAAFGQIFRGEAVNLPASRTSYGQWAKTLSRIAGEDAIREEATYWLETLQGRETLLFDGESGRGNTEGEAGLVTRILDQEKTTLLLRDVHKAYHTRIDDLLLAALARTMTNWTQNPSLLVTLERHGREQVAPQIDVSQTVGWFTCLFPLLLTPGELTDVGGNIRAVKEQLREVPQNGIGFGILRYLAPPEQRRLFAALPEPQILFNYLGQQASPAESATPLRPITAGIGQAYGPQNARYHLLDINARVEDGRLVVRWQYAGRQFQEAEIEALAGTYIAELEALIDHCMQVEEARYTPSDFPLAEIDQEDLDSLADLLEGLD
jgi:non-ribosomal peptide synthase protein (TIGR01720 family)